MALRIHLSNWLRLRKDGFFPMVERKVNPDSRWQVVAAKRYPRLHFIGGDGGGHECWVVMTKCPHQQTSRWRYALCATKSDAETLLEKWNKERCSYTCDGAREHSLWKIS